MNSNVRRFGRILMVIVAVAFGVRVAYVAIAKSGPCRIVTPVKTFVAPSQCAVGDQIYYNAASNRLAQGHGFVEPLWSVTHPGQKPPPAADHPPLTVIALAPVAWISTHPPVSWITSEPLHDNVREDRYAMVVLGTIVVFLVGLLGRRIGGDTVGLVAAGIAAITPNMWVNDGLVMSETVTCLVVVGSLLLAFALWDRPTLPRAFALGALCGLAALSRVELILFVPLLGVVVALTVRRAWADRGVLTAASLVAALVVIGPWVGFNLARFKDPTFISTNDGIALLGSNCDPVYYGSAMGLTSVAGPRDCLQNPPPPGDQSQVSSAYRKEAFTYISHHKSRVPLVVAARIGRTWGLFRPLDMVTFNVGEGREKWVTRLGIVAYYPTLLAAILGVVVLARRRWWRELYALLVPAAAVTVGVAVTYGQTRFRAGAEPSLAIFAAVGGVAVVRRLLSRRDTATSRKDPVLAADR